MVTHARAMSGSLEISVIIATRDTRALVTRCISSLLCAGLTADRIVVIDDGSTDGTTNWLRRQFPRMIVVRSAVSQGFTRAVNRGVLSAPESDLLWLLNSDTEVEPGATGALRSAFVADPRLGIVGPALFHNDGRAQWSGGPEPGLAWLFGLASGLSAAFSGRRLLRKPDRLHKRSVQWVPGAALAVRRATWEACGPLDERFELYAQDLDLCCSARACGWSVDLASSCRVIHDQGATVKHVLKTRGSQDPRRLCADLLRWAAKRRGAGWAQRARLALGAGIMARMMLRPGEWPAGHSADARGCRREWQQALTELSA